MKWILFLLLVATISGCVSARQQVCGFKVSYDEISIEVQLK